jgi:hypothetical protein
MKRIAFFAVFAYVCGSGCSNAPMAGFLDTCFPSRAKSGLGDGPPPPIDPRPNPAPGPQPGPNPNPNPNPLPPPDFGRN